MYILVIQLKCSNFNSENMFILQFFYYVLEIKMKKFHNLTPLNACVPNLFNDNQSFKVNLKR